MNKEIEFIDVIGEDVHKNHPSWKLINDIQHGIKYSIKVNNNHDNDIMKPTEINEIKLFYSTSKAEKINHTIINQDQQHNNNNNVSFKFKNYQPNAFKYLRKLFKIEYEEFLNSLCNDSNPLRELPTPGKSGSLFYFSFNMKFIIKTISKDESKLLRKILPKYISHIEQSTNNQTLIPKFYGMFRVENQSNKIRFIIIENLFPSNKKISLKFDLKGSFQDRETKNKPKNLDSITYKDIDFLNNGLKIKFENDQIKQLFINQIENDSKFLNSLNIMDYSLLIGIHYINNNNSDEKESVQFDNQIKLNEIKSKILINSSLLPSIESSSSSSSPSTQLENIMVEKNIIYYIGIIDILVLYNYKKKLAHYYKTIKYGSKSQISTIDPKKYCKRFKEFIINLIE